MSLIKLYKDGSDIYTPFDTINHKMVYLGEKSTIQEYNPSTLIKIYKDSTSNKDRISTNMFREVKELGSDIMPKFKVCLFDEPRSLIFPQRMVMPVKAYTYERIKKEYPDTFNMESDDFTGLIVERLDELTEELANRKIVMGEPKLSDMVVSNKGTFIVDPDRFSRKHTSSYNECIRMNKKVALELIKLYLIDTAEKKYHLGDQSTNIDILFDIDVNSNTSLTLSLQQRLQKGTLMSKLTK